MARYISFPYLLAMLQIASIILISFLPVGNTINSVLALFLTFVILVSIILQRREIWFSAEVMLIVLWLVYALLPSWLAVDQSRAMFKALTMVQLIVLGLILLQVSIWQNSTRGLLWAFVLSVCGSYIVTFTALNDEIIAAYLSTGVIETSGDTRTAGTLANANTFGVACALAQCLVLQIITGSQHSVEKILAAVAFLILTAGVINSGSRTAILAMILLLLALPWVFAVWKPERFFPLLKWGGVLLLLLVSSVFLLKNVDAVKQRVDTVVNSDFLQNRMQDMFSVFAKSTQDEAVELSGQSITHRVQLMAEAWNIASEHPLGIGLDNYAVHAGVYAHSNYMELLATTGFIGILIFYASYVLLMLKTLKLWVHVKGSDFPKTVLLGVMMLLLTDVANVSYYTKTTWLFFMLLIASLEIYRRKLQKLLEIKAKLGKARRLHHRHAI